MEDIGLVYVGKIIDIQPIPQADFIVSATIVCGKGGKWKGVIRKVDLDIGDLCLVYLPDALIPENEEMKFMASTNWRVKMRRFKGAPSEVVITKLGMRIPIDIELGKDVTSWFGVTKYHKPVPPNMQGKAVGEFPSFIPKTDEPNYQSLVGQEYIEKLTGEAYYITEKADGSSTTAYKYKGKFGVCSRNWELERDEENGYWKVAIKYDLENKLPEGIAIQWETCGPKIQSNPMGLKEISGYVFSAYNINEHKYLEAHELIELCRILMMPMCKIIECNGIFRVRGVELLGEGTYANSKQREGVVVRSQHNLLGSKPISFKVINLNYES